VTKGLRVIYINLFPPRLYGQPKICNQLVMVNLKYVINLNSVPGTLFFSFEFRKLLGWTPWAYGAIPTYGAIFDWCCFYYFARNSLVAFLEALCACIFFLRCVNIGFSWFFFCARPLYPLVGEGGPCRSADATFTGSYGDSSVELVSPRMQANPRIYPLVGLSL